MKHPQKARPRLSPSTIGRAFILLPSDPSATLSSSGSHSEEEMDKRAAGSLLAGTALFWAQQTGGKKKEKKKIQSSFSANTPKGSNAKQRTILHWCCCLPWLMKNSHETNKQTKNKTKKTSWSEQISTAYCCTTSFCVKMRKVDLGYKVKLETYSKSVWLIKARQSAFDWMSVIILFILHRLGTYEHFIQICCMWQTVEIVSLMFIAGIPDHPSNKTNNPSLPLRFRSM